MYLIRLKKGSVFAIFFVTPMMLFSVYTIFIRERQYESRADIVLRANVNEMFGFNVPQIMLYEYRQDLFMLDKYIKSFDILTKLNDKLMLQKQYQAFRIDLFSRYNGFYQESFLSYYQSKVKTEINIDTGIMTISVIDRDREFSYKLINEIILLSENYINDINNEINQKKITILENLTRSIKDKIVTTRATIDERQLEHKTFDAKKEMEFMSQTIMTLEGELIKQKTQLAELLSYMNKNSVEIKSIKDKINNIERKLNNLKTQIIQADKDNSGNYKSTQFANLDIELELFLKEYASIISVSEQVQANIISQSKNLIVIEKPFLAEYPKYPNILRNLSLCVILLLLFYTSLQTILNFIKEYE